MKYSTFKVVEYEFAMEWTDSIESTIVTLERGDKFHVPVGMRHQMYALEDTRIV